VNEYSARYSILDREFYIPSKEQLAVQSAFNRQGRDAVLDAEDATGVLNLLRENSDRAYDDYLKLLNEDHSGHVLDPDRDGLARELARMNLSLNFYTQWYWKIDLHNLMNFLQLRSDSHAQYEIRAYANVITEIIKKWVPLTHEAFLDYRVNATSLSAKATQALRLLLAGEKVTEESSGLTSREWRDLLTMFEMDRK
jgi:thymidylate synthase (FAD)